MKYFNIDESGDGIHVLKVSRRLILRNVIWCLIVALILVDYVYNIDTGYDILNIILSVAMLCFFSVELICVLSFFRRRFLISNESIAQLDAKDDMAHHWENLQQIYVGRNSINFQFDSVNIALYWAIMLPCLVNPLAIVEEMIVASGRSIKFPQGLGWKTYLMPRFLYCEVSSDEIIIRKCL